MRRLHFVLTFGLALALAIPATGQDRDEDQRLLKYSIAANGDAAQPSLAQPGRAGAYALRLACDLKSWARWDFPIFRPVAALERVSFWARRNGDLPPALIVRLLESDGSEWQSRPLDLTSEWKQYELTAQDFQYFRSRDSRKGTPLRMGNVIQVHFVPSSPVKKQIEVLLDDVSLEPGGPRYAFEESEQQKPMSAEQAAHARFAFLQSANRAMARHVDAEIEHAQQCLRDIRALLDAKGPKETFDDLVRRYEKQVKARSFAFQQQPPRFDSFLSDATAHDTASELNALARQFSAPPHPLCTFAKEELSKWSASSLYRARKPGPPEWVDGAIRQRVVFTPDNAQQVVFLNLRLDDLIDLRQRYDTVAFRYSISDNKINSKEGIRLRLYSEAPHESWTDDVAVLPKDIAVGKWAECKMPIHLFSRNSRFDPSKLRSVAFRIENQPGQAAEFDFSVSSLDLRCDRPYDLAINFAQKQSRDKVIKKRMELLRVHHRIGSLKRRMDPDLLRFYLWSQLTHSPGASESGPQPISDDLLRASAADCRGDLIAIARADANPDRAAGELDLKIRYHGPLPAPSHLEIALTDHAGRCIYSKKVEATPGGQETESLHLRSTISGVHYWWPGYPYLYTLKVGAFHNGKMIDAAIRKIGFARVEVRQGDLSATMRHARGLTGRDWSVWINGQPHFPIGTHAGLGGLKDPRDFTSLLNDLWMEFQRNYGFHPTSDMWDVFDEEGLMYTCPIHPKYSAIRSYGDVEGFLDEYENRLGMVESSLHHPSIIHYAIGNEAELPIWGADLSATFGNEIWQPMEHVARIVKQAVGDRAPVCYIRAGHFQRVPGVPSEDMSGVNQYTGRYGGRIEQVPSALRTLTLHSTLNGWPVMITEWNGPKYTWATTGIGGSSEHGCAYYIHKYWDAMLRSDAIVGSSEFVLNWVCTAIEDLTTVSIEEGMRRRPEYSPFGGGYTAGHVPHMWPGNIVKCETYQYLQAFQSPLYFLVNTPGRLLILHAPGVAGPAKEIAVILKDLGKPVEIEELRPAHDLSKVDANILLFGGIGGDQPAQIRDLESRMVIGKTMSDFPRPDMPLVQRRVNPFFPRRVLVVVTASGKAGYDIGLARLLESARGLRQIGREEGAMTRMLIFADAKARETYQYYFNEFAARGYFYGLDDFRTEIRNDEIMDEQGRLRQRFWNLSAVILDLKRTLDAAEMEALNALARCGVNIVVSRPCYEANPALQELLGVSIGKVRHLTESIRVGTEFLHPLEVPELGDACMDRIAKFLGMQEEAVRSSLEIGELSGRDVLPVAAMREGGQAVVVSAARNGGRWFVVGCALHEIFDLHCRVTRRGETHPLYDRDTACGLERLSRLVVNLCRAGAPNEKDARSLYGTIETSAPILKTNDFVHVRLCLTDEADRPVSGATVLVLTEYLPNGLGRGRRPDEPYVVVAESEANPGSYEFTLAFADDDHPPSVPGNAPIREVFIPRPEDAGAIGEAMVCLSLKAIKTSHLLHEDAVAILVEP
ncbi:MAG: hypothetical protein AB1696_08945 [Planctomycetota bacterium]